MRPILNKSWIFIVLPVVYFILSLTFLFRIQHFYITDFDFSYPYLLNGTNLASGHFRVGNIEHPGTPVEILAALIIFVKHLFAGDTILYQDVLLHPENYLFACCIVLAFLLSFVTYFSGTYVYRHTRSMLTSLLFQVSPLFYSELIRRTTLLSADAFIAITCICFFTYLYVAAFVRNQDINKDTTNRNIVLFGLFSALLFTTKIYCIPVVLLVLFMIKSWKQKILYLTSFGIFSLVLLFPLYNQLRIWAGTIKAMVLHSGAYGRGTSQILNSPVYRNSIIEIFTTHYVFTTVYILILAAFLISIWDILKRKRSYLNLISPITGIFIFFTLFILVIAKQYEVNCPNPVTHTSVTITKYYYFILLICCFPLAIAVSYKILYPIIPLSFFHHNKQKLLYGILVIFIAFGLKQAYGACYEVQDKNLSFEKTDSFIKQWNNTPLIIIEDGGEQIYVEGALLVGISYAGKWYMHQYFDFLKKKYPDIYMYSLGWRDALTFWGTETNILTILEKNNKALVYISGADSLSERITLDRICRENPPIHSVTYKKVYSSDTKYESIYLVSANTR